MATRWFTRDTAEDVEAALALVRDERVPVVPCFSHNKAPAARRGLYDATTLTDRIRRGFAPPPSRLVGVPTGPTTGIAVIDVDPRNGGEDWLYENFKRLPASRVHETRSGGFHLLFRHPPGLKNSAGKIAPGVDVRAEGGYIIWWPAHGFPVHDDTPLAKLAEWPKWVLPEERQRPPAPRGRILDRYGLQKLVDFVARAGEGERNSVLFWAACRVGDCMFTKGLGAFDAESLLIAAAAAAGLEEQEAQRTIHSAWRRSGVPF